MTRHISRVTVTTAPVRIDDGQSSVICRNLDPTVSVYLGPSDVTSSTGLPLKAGESFEDVNRISRSAEDGTPVPEREPLYAVVATGTAAISIMTSGA
jgi:hypothetical protein